MDRTPDRRTGVAARARLALLLALSFCALPLGASAHAAAAQDTRVVGGSATTIEEWPWQVAIAEPPSTGGNGYQRQFCGGTLVSPTAVLTAAHCVYDGGFVQPGAQTVITGRTTLSSNAGAELALTDVIYFREVGGQARPQSVLSASAGTQLYDDSTSEWDAAILELASPAPAPAAPVAIASPAERSLWGPGDPAFATGWGDTTGGGTYADDLREVELNVIADSDCGDLASYGSDFFPATMVCAGISPAGGRDTCQGDSGGPLVVPAGDGSYRLIGDTSFGEGCALPEKYGVYGRVADSTMRPALIEAISLADGGAQPAPTPTPTPTAVDRTAPQTTIGKRPPKRTRRRRAKFTWNADESATFSCRLDRRAAKPCSSPFRKRVRRGRRHTFRVAATDAAGNVEAKPARYSWKVRKRRRR